MRHLYAPGEHNIENDVELLGGSLMTSDQFEPVGKVPRWWGGICLLCGIPFFFDFAYLGHPDKGLVATYAVAMIVLFARIFWRLRHRVWFWGMLVFGDARFPGGFKAFAPTGNLLGRVAEGASPEILFTARVGTFAGRAVPLVGEAILAYDAISIGVCVYNAH